MTVYQAFFEIDISISERFAITPFQIRREKADEVFLLLRRLNEHYENDYISKGGKKGDKIVTQSNGEQVIFRPATNTSGF